MTLFVSVVADPIDAGGRIVFTNGSGDSPFIRG